MPPIASPGAERRFEGFADAKMKFFRLVKEAVKVAPLVTWLVFEAL